MANPSERNVCISSIALNVSWMLHLFFLQGVRGAYSESAAEKAYPYCEAVPCEQFETAFEVNTFKPFAHIFTNVYSILLYIMWPYLYTNGSC